MAKTRGGPVLALAFVFIAVAAGVVSVWVDIALVRRRLEAEVAGRRLAETQVVLAQRERQTAEAAYGAYVGTLQTMLRSPTSSAEQAVAALAVVSDAVAGGLDDDPPAQARYLEDVAFTMWTLGALTTAEPRLARALAIREGKMNPDDPETIGAHVVYGNLLRELGREADALQELSDALADARRALGLRNEATIQAMLALADMKRRMAQRYEAVELYEELLEPAVEVLGPDHPQLLKARQDLATLYVEMDRWKDADPLFAQVYEDHVRLLGVDRPETDRIMRTYALLLEAGAEDKHRPIEFFEHVVQQRRDALGDDHPLTLEANALLGAYHLVHGDLDEGCRLLAAAVEGLDAQGRQETQPAINALFDLALCLSHQAQLLLAEEYFERVVELRTKTLGADHPETIKAVQALDRVRARQ